MVGSGGREDALAWALSRSPSTRLLRCAPGNAGIARWAERVPIPATEIEALAVHAKAERYDLVVIGPEGPLVAGLADRLRERGVAVFGPSAAAAAIEGSKVFAKQFSTRHGIPTAAFEVFSDATAARAFLESSAARYPLVIKADGLAAGKGVVLADDRDTAVRTAQTMLDGRAFGAAGRRIVVEERLEGREVSFFVLTDGESVVELATCQDYKRALDGDRGPNTGGMGGYSPSVHLDDALRQQLLERFARPAVFGLAAEERPYRGVLYLGVMLTAAGPRLLEFNARFGDPETQVLVPRLDGDWLELLALCARGGLNRATPRWRRESAVCVVMTSADYPDGYATGQPIAGLDAAADPAEGLHVFHAGTELDGTGRTVTSGGRVLGVTALAPELAEARQRAYAAVGRIHWTDERHRRDIGADAVAALGRTSNP